MKPNRMTMTSRAIQSLGIFLLLTILMVPVLMRSAFSEGLAPAGYVTAIATADIDGKPGAVIRREGQELEVQVWTPLFAGDEIDVRGDGKITIETVHDKRRVIDSAQSPHRIEGAMASGGRFTELASRVGELFKAKPARDSVSLIGRTDPSPRLHLGERIEQRVAPGTSLWLRWEGGTSPFTIELQGQTSKRRLDIGVLASSQSDARDTTFKLPAAASGRLALIIRDANGLETKADLTTADIPKMPEWIMASAPTQEFAKIAYALHLLGDAGHSYDMMAAAITAEIKNYPPAAALLEQLAKGKRPK